MKRIYSATLKASGIAAGSFIGLLFLYLLAVGAISNVSYSGDMICAGTELDPCYAYINFTANEDIFIYPTDYDPWGRDTLFDFDPSVRDWKLERSWGDGWRNIPLNKTCTGTWCGASNNKGCSYSVAFRDGRDYRIRIVALKNNPTDTIKWGAFSGMDKIDPTWFGVGVETGGGIRQVRQVFNGNYKVISQTNNETLYDVEFEKIDIERTNQSNRIDTIICAKANFSEKEVVTFKLDDKTEKEIVDKIYTYSVPDKISFYKNTSLSKQPDIERSLTKSNELSLISDKFEEGDEYEFCYQANPDEDFYLKLGDNSIIIIQDSDWITDSLLTNVTAESGDANFTHLNISNTAPWNSLVGYWSADGDLADTKLTTAYDWSGEGNDGDMKGDAVSTAGGRYGKGFEFDGAGDYITVGTGTDFSDLCVNGCTFSAWEKFTDDNLNNVIFARHDNSLHGGFKNRFVDFYISGTEQINLIVSYDGTGETGTECIALAGSKVISGDWHHVVGVYNTTDIIVYNNGVAGTPVTCTYSGISLTDWERSENTFIGVRDDGSYLDYFNGSIDDVMIFNSALNSTQISDIYNNQSARFLETGTQDIYNQTYMNISSGNNRVNVSTTIQENLGSDINLSVGYYDGSWSATAPQVVVSGVNNTFIISGTSTNLTLNYTFVAGNDSTSFYSPIIEGDISFEAWDGGAAVGTADINYTTPLGLGFIRFTNCSPQWEWFPSVPNGQTASIASINATNNGSATGSFGIKLSGAANTNWTLFASNQSDLSQNITLTTSIQTIWANVAAGVTKQIWMYANCSYVSTNPGADIIMEII